MIISLIYNKNLEYAACEAEFFFNKYTTAETVKNLDGDRRIVLKTDDNMPWHHYYIHGDGTTLEISGGNASSLLSGVYEALSAAGIVFTVDGYSVPRKFDLEAMFALNREVKPKFRYRGIRQHINFPMDVSSYSVKEAEEYFRNLARMRFNAITFHSYSGQWHEANVRGEKDNAGHFFYGKTYQVYKLDALTAGRVNNKKYYCSPDVECVYEDQAAKGEFAKYWLNRMMETAKRAGMTITLSVEITFDDDEGIVAMLRSILDTYPLIDTLELISEECGGFRDMPELNMDNIKDFIVSTFDRGVLDENGSLTGLPDFVPHQLGSSAISVRRVLKAFELRDKWLVSAKKDIGLRAGIYLTCPDTLKVLRPILRNRLPEGFTMSLLPAHGAKAVADNVAKTGTLTKDWQNTMFYSWAEFDGNMFIQQLSTDGIEQLVSMAEGQSVYGLCINHWRTAENSLTLSYAAEAMISGRHARDFYEEYAAKTGISDVAAFAETCSRLAWLDTYNRDNLFNVGFCAVGCWLNWCRRGDAIIPRGFPSDVEMKSIETYEEIIDGFKRLLIGASTPQAIAFIRLMINRCQTSILHLRSLLTLDKIFEIYDYSKPRQITAQEKTKIKSIIDESMGYAVEYMHLYGEIMPDRGAEGQLVSYYDTTVTFINAVAENFGDDKSVVATNDYDAPPMPDAQVK